MSRISRPTLARENPGEASMRVRRSLLAVAGLVFAANLASAQSPGLTITWAEDDGNPRTFDPRVTQSRHESQLIIQVFDTLIASDENNNYSPGLARSWELAGDGMSITLKLRDDVTFHDGTKFDAEAVKFNFDSIRDPKLGSRAAIDILGPYAGSDVIGPYEIKVRYTRPYAPAVASLSQNELSPVSPTAVRLLGDGGFGAAPVGTGPFKFVNWERGKQVVLDRYEPYNWAPGFTKHKGPSKVARVIHRSIPDASTRVAALERGEVDITDFTPILDVRRLGQDRRYKTMLAPASGLPFGILLNSQRGVFQDIRVRQAFMHGFDRKALTDDMYFGLIEPAYGPLSKTTVGYWPEAEKYYPYDPGKATQLLEAAGWKMGPGGIRAKDGQPLTTTWQVLAVVLPEVGVAAQADLKKIGFDVKVETITAPRWDELVFTNANEINPLRWISADPSLLEIQFHSRNIPEPGRFRFNLGRLSDPALDKLLEQGAGEIDPVKRNAVYADAQKRIMDAAVWFPIHNQVNPIAYRANRTGYRFARAQWTVRFYEVEEVK
ncbi:MAG: ABC transporter substrate-binding protein [Alphaproteobacteria bacterium]|nr:ABC transporter substrate-binding protein [Alphaproteobacteria bacterium]